MFIILFIVIALVAWALHLMQEAIERNEFSLMLAGTLVAAAAAAMVGVYFLMANYMGYVNNLSDCSTRVEIGSDRAPWIISSEEGFVPFEGSVALPSPMLR